MQKIQFKCSPINWFAAETLLAWEEWNIITSWFFTSDNIKFFTYIKSIEKHFSSLMLNLHSNFFIVIKPDYNCTVYLIDSLVISFSFNVPKNKWEPCFKYEITWIWEISLEDFDIWEKDWIIFCFKENWKFWLYFDFTPLFPSWNNVINKEQLAKKLWKAYTFLFYNEELDYINKNEIYDEMIKDWWFPFFEILWNYSGLYEFYKEWKVVDAIFQDILKKFNNEYLIWLFEKWVKDETFNQKKDLLRAWIDAYISDTKSWYINCIKTLWTEIEWLLQYYYFWNTWKYNNTDELIKYLKNKINNSNKSSLLSLWFNEKFIEYLEKNVFNYFDLKTWKIDISRHTVWHWYAKDEEYTKIKALQYILIIDQLHYYFIEK
ncbi:MAG: hypothetical protein ACD_4C00022G0005 [uncultured bacterium (gcode 4)]|uniref:Uncharacterized protein n=1 Tax=uncultured bacterium (gcode 4) TaxID=1234023 RepID=K2FZ35_9BACT|nr:MAG: hypothetical protein ACD_4C00022G0005 [uncultured bacterium (gcode 4)]